MSATFYSKWTAYQLADSILGSFRNLAFRYLYLIFWRVPGQMQLFAQVVQLHLRHFFNGMELLFDHVDRLRIRFLDLFREPISLNDVENDDSGHHDKEEGNTDLFK